MCVLIFLTSATKRADEQRMFLVPEVGSAPRGGLCVGTRFLQGPQALAPPWSSGSDVSASFLGTILTLAQTQLAVKEAAWGRGCPVHCPG